MGAGVVLSAAGHAAVIALAVWALPWMRPGPERPGQVVSASLVTPAELAALSQAAPPNPAAAPPPAVRAPATAGAGSRGGTAAVPAGAGSRARARPSSRETLSRPSTRRPRSGAAAGDVVAAAPFGPPCR